MITVISFSIMPARKKKIKSYPQDWDDQTTYP